MTATAPVREGVGSALPAWGVLAILLCGALTLYANTLSHEFVFDDLDTVLPFQESLRGASLLELLSGQENLYRPVRYLSFAVDYLISGEAPWGYHLMNAVFHGLTAFVVFLVLRKLSASSLIALAGALLFLVHPVHTDSVAYVSGRRDILTTLFYLLALLADRRHAESGRWGWALAAFAAFLLAVGAKEMAATFPIMAIMMDRYFGTYRAAARLPVYLAYAAVTAYGVWVAVSGGYTEAAFHGGSLWSNFLTVAVLWVHYLGLLLFPATLLADYSFEAFPISHSLWEPRALGALAVLVCVAVGAWVARRRAPLVTLGIVWFFVTLMPVSHLFPFQEIAAEHYLYLPSVGFCLIAGLAFERVFLGVDRRVAMAAAVAVLIAFSLRTIVRNQDWRDSETLWTATLEAAPRCARAHVNMGVIRARRGEYALAVESFRAAVEIRPMYLQARMRLAELYAYLGEKQAMRDQFRAMLEHNPRLQPRPYSQGYLLYRLGCYALADTVLYDEIRAGGRPQLLAWRARTLTALDRHWEALMEWERYLGKRPGDADAVREAGHVASRAGEAEQAMLLWERARELSYPGAPGQITGSVHPGDGSGRPRP